ncbi:MAG TPA: type IV secretion system protein [Patescibacteria group bacterium]|nr:type IV secretion system protein [Patescibacteria group bacterium]
MIEINIKNWLRKKVATHRRTWAIFALASLFFTLVGPTLQSSAQSQVICDLGVARNTNSNYGPAMNKNRIYGGETFRTFLLFKLPEEMVKACGEPKNVSFEFSYNLTYYDGTNITYDENGAASGTYANQVVKRRLISEYEVQSGKNVGYKSGVDNTLEALFSGVTTKLNDTSGKFNNFKLKVYGRAFLASNPDQRTNGNENLSSWWVSSEATIEPGSGTHPETNLGLTVTDQTGNQNTGNVKTDYKAEEIRIKYSGVNTVYRITKEEVGKSLDINYTFDWASEQHPNPASDTVDGNPFRSVFVGFDYDRGNNAVVRCSGLWGTGNCNNAKGSFGDATGSFSLPKSGTINIPITQKANERKDGIGIEEEGFNSTGSATPGTKLGSKGYVIFPVLRLGGPGNDIGYYLSAAHFQVELYENEVSRRRAYENNGINCTNEPEKCKQTAGTEQTGQAGTQATSGQLNKVEEIIAQVLGWFFDLINRMIYWLFGFLVAPLLTAFLGVRTYKDEFVNIVLPGWQLLRDMMNIGFILAIIFTGLTTVFRVGGHGYKEMLISIIMAALLVNFGLVVAQGVLGIADTLQNQFLPAHEESVKNLAKNLMVTPVQNFRENLPQLVGGQGLTDIVGYLIISTAVAFGSFIVFCTLVAYLAIRIVGLLILLMLSPIAFGAGALPQTKGLSSKWWDNFLHYAFFTPIIGFFVNVSAIISTQQFFSYQSLNLNNLADSSFSGQAAQFVVASGGHILMLVFLVAGMQVANKLGIAGAGAITKMADKAWKAPFLKAGQIISAPAAAVPKLAKMGAERAFEGVQNKLGVTLDPRIWKHEIEHFFEEQKQKRLKARQATGTRFANPHDALEAYATWHGWKRMATKAGRKLAGKTTDVGQVEHEIGKLKKRKDGLLAYEQREEMENKLASLQGLTSGTGEKLTVSESEEQLAVVGEELAKAKEKRTKLTQELKDLKEPGSGASATEITDKETELKKAGEKFNALNELSKRLKTDIEAAVTTGATQIDWGAIRTGLVGVAGLTATTVSDNMDALLKPIKDKAPEEIKKIQRRLKYDRALKQSYGIQVDISPTVKANPAAFKKAKDDILAAVNHQREHLKEEIEHEEHVSSSMRMPEMYAQRTARLEAEGKEQSKIRGIDDADELIRLYKDAVHEGNFARAGAVMKKLAQDQNFNELLAATGNETSLAGMQKFFDDFARETKMNPDQKFQLASEVGYINEAGNWWDLSRVTKVGSKGLEWASNDTHQKIISNEMSKRFTQRAARDFGRLAYVTEDTTGAIPKRKLHKAGIDQLKRMDYFDARNELKRNMRSNTANAIMGDPEWDKKLSRAGVSPDMLAVIRTVAAKKD